MATAPMTPPQESNHMDLTEDVIAKGIKPFGKDFPRIEGANVFIQLGKLSPKASYQLHSSTLERMSPWFEQTLAHRMEELDYAVAKTFTKRTGVRIRYHLEFDSDLHTFVLARTVSLAMWCSKMWRRKV